MGKRDKKQQEQETGQEVAGYDKGHEAEFAGDSEAGPEEPVQQEQEPNQSNSE